MPRIPQDYAAEMRERKTRVDNVVRELSALGLRAHSGPGSVMIPVNVAELMAKEIREARSGDDADADS